jgi:hypothetical protein
MAEMSNQGSNDTYLGRSTHSSVLFGFNLLHKFAPSYELRRRLSQL